MARCYFRGSRSEARQLVSSLVLALTGHGPDTQQIARGVFLAVGFAALSDIKDDFVRKARGGTGEDGVKWAPLKRETIAYGRRAGPNDPKGKKGGRGLLTAAQNKRWKKIFGGALARLLLSLPEGEAKARAAQIAWATLKREGAKTKLDVLGSRSVEILRDTGILLNSLSPGQLGGGSAGMTYRKPGGDGGDEQIFETIANGVIVGTNVPYASVHQDGSTKKKIPARPFLPKGNAPAVWRERWLAVGRAAIFAGLKMLFTATP
jgi:hypothetical protein